MNADSKSIFTSVTFWGILIGFLSQFATRLGYHVPADTAGLANDIAGVAGSLLAIYGRLTASQPVHIVAPSAAAPTGGGQSGFAMPRFLAVLALVAAAACTTVPQTPAQSVYAVQGSYAAALSIAVAYKGLPSCTQSPRPIACSDAAIVAKLQAADDAAFAALTAAQNVVRSPNAGLNAQTAITAANQAVQALVSITSTLGVKQ